MNRKKASLSFALIMCMFGSAFAQTKDFRDKGYKGSVSLSDQFGVWVGLETSHGCMIDSKNYIGGGLGVHTGVFSDSFPTFGTLFADYQHYFKDTKSTPVLGAKLGWYQALNTKDDSGWNFKKAAFVEPDFGWSWRLKSGNGLMLTLGIPVYIPTDGMYHVTAMPKLSFGFEF